MKKMFLRFAFLFLIAIFNFGCGKGTQQAFQADTSVNTCGKSWMGFYPISWCREYSPSSDSKDVIYYFHGINGSERAYHQSPLRNALLRLMKSPPQVISISFGPRWFLSDVHVLRDSRLNVFNKLIQPAIEKELGFQPRRRILMGESMGGYSVLRLAAERPHSFAKVVAMCAAVMSYDPFLSGEERSTFYAKNPFANPDILAQVKYFGFNEFWTLGAWKRNNPLNAAESSTYALPPVLISTNERDEYGFTDGSMKFVKLLHDRSITTKFIYEHGSHCTHDPGFYEQVVQFLE